MVARLILIKLKICIYIYIYLQTSKALLASPETEAILAEQIDITELLNASNPLILDSIIFCNCSFV